MFQTQTKLLCPEREWRNNLSSLQETVWRETFKPLISELKFISHYVFIFLRICLTYRPEQFAVIAPIQYETPSARRTNCKGEPKSKKSIEAWNIPPSMFQIETSPLHINAWVT